MDWNIISSIATAGSAVVATVAWFALKAQIRQGHENLCASILREHERQFYYSETFSVNRSKCCKFLLDELSGVLANTDDKSSSSDWLNIAVETRRKEGSELNREGWEIVDFLDSLGIYGDQGTVDIEMAFAKFYYAYSRYWFLLEPWIPDYRKCDGNVDYYQDIDLFLNEMVRYGKRKRGLVVHNPRYTPDNVLQFLHEEIESYSS